MSRRIVFLLLLVLGWTSSGLAAEPITLSSLLDEMVDRAAIARFPSPSYTCGQASSYDRGTVSPDEPGWFANNDRSFFVRQETNDGREEWVMMDEQGPGAIVRWWVTAPAYVGMVRVYLDGSDTPVIAEKVDDLVGGEALVGAPLSEESARGRNLYLPIPYAKSCKVTFDRPNFHETKKGEDLLYYQINFRSYEAGTDVKSFTMETFDGLRDKINTLQRTLAAAPLLAQGQSIGSFSRAGGEADLTVDGDDGLHLDLEGPGAVRRLAIDLTAEDMAQATRSTVLKIEFDGEETVWCPVGEFFGGGVGLNPFHDWWRRVEEDGKMACLYPMPFEKSCRITIVNLDPGQVVKCRVSAMSTPWDWDERSMHFHCDWRQEREIKTKNGGSAALDWNYVTIEGKGVYVGDTLSVLNRVSAWWGEGDEKITVDGEAFPSHVGTGTEDYYGYAWCTPAFFESPFHAQPRAEGPGNFGNTTNSRVRLLDGIPFTRSLNFDMEVWHWRETTIDYAVATYWYALPGATSNVTPSAEEAKQPVAYDSPLFDSLKGFKAKGRPNGSVRMQDMKHFGPGWEDDDHLWWTDAKPGDKLTLLLPVEKAGRKKLVVSLTKAKDYGIVRFSLDGKKVGEPIDLYNPTVVPSGPIELGVFDLPRGESELTVEIVGANEAADKAYMFGIDRAVLTPVE